MRLVEGAEDGRYTLHPAVRDGFLRGMAITNSRDGNRAVCDTLLAGLRTGPGAPPPTELTTLDEIEELIHHTLELDDVNEAWQLFEYRMGGFENLGWRLGAFERIDRILRRIAQHVPAPGASALGLVARRALEHAWARSLAARGEIAQAIARCTVVRDQGLYDEALIELDMLAELYVLSGRLRHALECVEEALTHAKHQGDHEAKARTLGLLVHIQALRGKRLAAKQAAHGQAQRELDEPFFHVRRLPAMHHLTRLGELDEAARILDRAEQVDRASWGGDGPAIQALALERAEIALAHGDHDRIEPRVRAVREWATQHDAKELLCWSGRLLIEQRLQAWHTGTAVEPAELRAVLQLAMVEVDRARSNGLGLYHIDLRIQRARLRLLTGDPLAAIADLAIAFEDGLPADDSGPDVPAARQPSCKYAWGVADARRCLGHALLLYVAIDLGDAKGDPRTLLERPEVRAAIRELESARNVMHTMGDPRADEIERELEAVARGLLTASPLDRVVEPLAEADRLRATRVITAALAAAR
ncbi:MAG TPA: hypothetical protein VF516_14835 [Kofleriaceae bacterium]